MRAVLLCTVYHGALLYFRYLILMHTAPGARFLVHLKEKTLARSVLNFLLSRQNFIRFFYQIRIILNPWTTSGDGDVDDDRYGNILCLYEDL